MDGPHSGPGDPHEARFDALLAEAREALAYGANTLRSVRDRFRERYTTELADWDRLRDELARVEREPAPVPAVADPADEREAAAAAAEAGAEDIRRRTLRADVGGLGDEVGRRQAELGRLELAIGNLERTWLFLDHADTTLIAGEGDAAGPDSLDLRMRIVEAQEAERARLAQEVHDGPAQALTNAVFQVEYVQRLRGESPDRLEGELRALREVLLRELGDIRAFISLLRPPAALEAGLDEAIRDVATQFRGVTRVDVDLRLDAASDGLSEAASTVALRITQEAFQNIRKHASARSVVVTTAIEDGRWAIDIRDDGAGFDVGAVAARGRRNFGLQFMHERAELIGADFEVRSRPDGGTAVRLAIPMAQQEG